jgi:imidazolonepropionase-like amidohydrolase
VIDGTGAPAKEDQTVIIEQGRISSLGSAGSVSVPTNANEIELRGYTVIPGLVGMHDHLFYAVDRGNRYVTADQSFSRLYLACGVTSLRTTGTIDLKRDLAIKKSIDEGKVPGPKIHITSPYINATGVTANPEKIVRNIDTWAGQGATSFKVYTSVGRSELEAAVQAAHRRGLKVTGHLCAVGFREAAALGIDNLEHGLFADTEFYSRKRPDECPDWQENVKELVRMDMESGSIKQTIQDLVNRGVAITSTLPVYETFIGRVGSFDPRTHDVLAPEAYSDYSTETTERIRAYRANGPWAKTWEAMLKKEMQFEREFAKAGGLLMAGVDPTGWGGVVAGFGDQREVELLVEAGFTPEEAIRIASANGAEFLGESERIGTLEVGKQADIVVIRGNPSANIADIRNVEVVFKDGVGYDSAKLIASVQSTVGSTETDWMRVVGWIVIVASVSFLVFRRFRRAR